MRLKACKADSQLLLRGLRRASHPDGLRVALVRRPMLARRPAQQSMRAWTRPHLEEVRGEPSENVVARVHERHAVVEGARAAELVHQPHVHLRAVLLLLGSPARMPAVSEVHIFKDRDWGCDTTLHAPAASTAPLLSPPSCPLQRTSACVARQRASPWAGPHILHSSVGNRDINPAPASAPGLTEAHLKNTITPSAAAAVACQGMPDITVLWARSHQNS